MTFEGELLCDYVFFKKNGSSNVHERVLYLLSNAFCQTDKYQILICVVFLALLLNLSSLMDLPHDTLFIMESTVIFKRNDSSYD